MILEIDKGEIAECVKVIRSSFKTVADEFGFTCGNAPRFTAFATTEKRLLYQLEGAVSASRQIVLTLEECK